jgi:hypothetical protein
LQKSKESTGVPILHCGAKVAVVINISIKEQIVLPTHKGLPIEIILVKEAHGLQAAMKTKVVRMTVKALLIWASLSEEIRVAKGFEEIILFKRMIFSNRAEEATH